MGYRDLYIPIRTTRFTLEETFSSMNQNQDHKITKFLILGNKL